jgi:signal transduction histidine kinase
VCHEAEHTERVERWIRQAGDGLSSEQLLELFEQAMSALWERTHLTLGPISGSRRFEISLVGALNEVNLTVRDSGTGFDPERALKGNGLGLISMKERMNLAGGELSIESQPQLGTTIYARVDLSPGKSAGAAG